MEYLLILLMIFFIGVFAKFGIEYFEQGKFFTFGIMLGYMIFCVLAMATLMFM